MRRREIIKMLGGAAVAWPLASLAQARPGKLRVGIVSSIVPRSAPLWVAFDQRMRELGYAEERNLAVEFINLHGQTARFPEAMRELVGRGTDILIASGTELALKSALAATRTVPIVVIAVDYDPLALGYVSDLSRPGGNVTGLVFQQVELAAKRVQLVREAFPESLHAIVFWDEISSGQWQAALGAAPSLGMQLHGIQFSKQPFDFEGALASVPPEYRSALMVMMSPLFFLERGRLAEAALRQRMGSMFGVREYVEAGGMLSYGASFDLMYRRVAEYVDRIAQGARPGDLPIEQPTKFELIVNLKPVRALGLSLPPAILARADEVIE